MKFTMIASIAVFCAGRFVAAQSPDLVAESYRAHLAAAEMAARLGEPAEARRWLTGAPRERRGWEWSHLDLVLDQSQVIARELPSGVAWVALHPSEPVAAFALAAGPIELWDTETKNKIAEFAGHAGGTFSVRFDPSGSRLVSAGVDRVARIWDVATGNVLTEFKEHRFPVAAALFSRDGTQVYSASYFYGKDTPIEGRVHLWNAEGGELQRTFRGGVKPLSSLALSPDGAQIAAGSWDSCVFVWDTRGDDVPKKLGGKPGPLQNVQINAVAFSPDGQWLAAGSDANWAKVYRVSDRAEVATLKDAQANILAVGFSPDGLLLATGGDNGAIKFWQTSDWTPKNTLWGHTRGVRTLVFNSDSTKLISGSADRTVRAWDAVGPSIGGLRARFGKNNYSAKFTADGNMLACSSSDGTIGFVDAHDGREVARWSAHPDREVCTAAASPDGTRLASCSWDKSLRVFDAATHNEIANVALPSGAAFFAWHPNGKMAAVALTDKTSVLIDLSTNAVVKTMVGHAADVKAVAFNRDGSRLLSGSGDKTARVWSVETGQCLATMKGHGGPIESVVFLPDDASVATASHDGSVRIWDAAKGELVRILHSSDDAIYRIAASPDGRRIAAGGKYLYLLDPQVSGALLREKPLSETIWHLDWSPDGQRLAVTSWNGEIIVFGGKR
jgi:WD40 repeat protein